MRASDRAYQRLRREILDGTLPPGRILGEVEQAHRLGVSRTPLREALARLSADGLADQSLGRGTVVSSVSGDDVGQLFELRIPLEVQAARLAAERGDPEHFRALARRFAGAEQRLDAQELAEEDECDEYYALAEELDAAVSEAVANPYLTNALDGLRVHLVRVRRLARDTPQRLLASAREHRQVCEAIAAQDPESAGAAMLLHLRRSLAAVAEHTSPGRTGSGRTGSGTTAPPADRHERIQTP